jgi:predicted PurR-regulated permease PerM
VSLSSLVCLALVSVRGDVDVRLGPLVIEGFIYELITFFLMLGMCLYVTWTGYPFWSMFGEVVLAFIIAWALTKIIVRLPDRFPESAFYTLVLLAGVGFGIAFLAKFTAVADAFRFNSAIRSAVSPHQ